MRALFLLFFLSTQAQAFTVDWVARLKCFVVTASAQELKGTTNFLTLPEDKNIYAVVLGKGEVLGAWSKEAGYRIVPEGREEILWLLRYEVKRHDR